MEKTKRNYLLILGDVILFVLVTIIGFARHETLGTAGARMLATFIPLLLAWMAAAPFLNCYSPEVYAAPRQLWRPVWAMVLAAPMAAFLRSLLLGGAPILPVFVLVMMGVSALGILVWRGVFVLIVRKKEIAGG